MYNGRRDGQSRDSMLTTAVQTAVYHTIFIDPTFTIDMPKISPEMWDRVCVTTPENVEENERLEFLGDQLMDACIGIDLYRNIPDGTPHKYTVSPLILCGVRNRGLDASPRYYSVSCIRTEPSASWLRR